jgi:hypothetical protein
VEEMHIEMKRNNPKWKSDTGWLPLSQNRPPDPEKPIPDETQTWIYVSSWNFVIFWVILKPRIQVCKTITWWSYKKNLERFFAQIFCKYHESFHPPFSIISWYFSNILSEKYQEMNEDNVSKFNRSKILYSLRIQRISIIV